MLFGGFNNQSQSSESVLVKSEEAMATKSESWSAVIGKGLCLITLVIIYVYVFVPLWEANQ